MRSFVFNTMHSAINIRLLLPILQCPCYGNFGVSAPKEIGDVDYEMLFEAVC